MRSRAYPISCTLLLGICVCPGLAQQPAKDQAPPKQAAGARSMPQTETIPPPESAQTPQPVHAPGYMEPAQVKIVAQHIWQAEMRVRDLLKGLHPERWKTSDITRKSFNQTLENLHNTLDALEQWRRQFEDRPDSMYLGFQTYATINAVLPRLDGVGRTASHFENTSLVAQYSEVGDRLFDLQQALAPYIAYLLRNPDQLLEVSQTNLAGCQKQLGSLHGPDEPAQPMKNTFVELHTRRHANGQLEEHKSPQNEKKKATDKTDKKTESESH